MMMMMRMMMMMMMICSVQFRAVVSQSQNAQAQIKCAKTEWLFKIQDHSRSYFCV